ncbi:MAG TPA: DUF4912 domain-containing protein [Firmicutes bacterium]|nr:DUF4912 domain-containing protein [Bacillota bacterium]
MQAPDRLELNAGSSLPAAYGVDRLVILPRDPHTLFVYWEITPLHEQELRNLYPDRWEAGKTVLVVFSPDCGCRKSTEIPPGTDNWYFNGLAADCLYRAELGRMLGDGTFVSLAVSNTVRTPRNSLSAVIDPRWRMFAFWQHRYRRRLVGGYSSAEFTPLDCGLQKED